ncbi:MAG: hypothetical protein M0Q88_00230 [Bacilli bacterium]|nr:hypothetical protein [Bacilli bacterium]
MNKELEVLIKNSKNIVDKYEEWAIGEIKNFADKNEWSLKLMSAFIEKALTPPTSEEVCKALSDYYNLPVKFYLQHNCFVIVKRYEPIIIVEQEVKNKNVRFNNKKAMPALPPHLITLIGRFYEGVLGNG